VTTHTMRLPDVGEGVAEAELVEWLVAVGDTVTPDTVIAEVLTDKATVEISAPVSGVVAALHGEPGDVLAIGNDFVEIATEAPEPRPVGRPTAAPAVRRRAAELGIDLATVTGSGPDGRVLHTDLGPIVEPRPEPSHPTGVAPVRGVRRRIAERLSTAWREIPHITYVDAVDVTELERLRIELNQVDGRPRLTILPLLVAAIAVAVADQPHLNAHYDAAGETLTTFGDVHVGIATQTDDGLRVPVVRDVGSRDLRALAAEIARVSDAARNGTATRDELTGSTISVTSLGALGGLVTTPIINPPEVAIIGVNKIEVRPVWSNGAFVPRSMMNLSSSFDHRMVDGWDAAMFVQRIRTLLETPALLFVR
jgi:2-oxoisovalerate dehydrogenase E2 component (dihydrolipoyl transacylase)